MVDVGRLNLHVTLSLSLDVEINSCVLLCPDPEPRVLLTTERISGAYKSKSQRYLVLTSEMSESRLRVDYNSGVIKTPPHKV